MILLEFHWFILADEKRVNYEGDKNKNIETSDYCNTLGKIIFFSSSPEHHSLLLLLNSTKFYTSSYFL